MKRFVVITLILVANEFCFAQNNGCNIDIFSFKSGERIEFRGVYNWTFIWINAGDVVFTVSDTIYNGHEAYYFCAKGWSLKEYDWFFKVRDKFESIVQKDGYKPLWFERNTSEGGFNVFNRYIYNYSDSTVSIASQTSERAYKIEEKELPPCTFDLLSAIYYCRNLDFSNCKPDEIIPLSMVVDDEIFSLYIRYKGREIITSREGTKYNTIKFSIKLVEGTVFNAGEDMTVWITDDVNRVPVLVQAKILVGSVKALLKSASSLEP